LRRARVLRAIGALVVSSYLILPVVSVLVVVRGGVGGLSTRDWVAVGIGSAVVLAAAASVIALVAARGPRKRLRGWAGAQLARPDDERALAPALSSFALARGVSVPAMWVTDAAAVNAFAYGRADASNLCVTQGALELPPHELAALSAVEMTALTYAPYRACIAAIDLMLFAEWCMRVLWPLAWVVLISPMIGVPPLVAGVWAFGEAHGFELDEQRSIVEQVRQHTRRARAAAAARQAGTAVAIDAPRRRRARHRGTARGE
jgi:hypothetical protein